MAARLVIRSIDGRRIQEKVEFAFDQDRLVVGRGRSADVRLPDHSVSEVHATLTRGAQGYTLTDEGSTNGTRVGDAGLVAHRARRLADGDALQVGIYHLSFHVDVHASTPLTEERAAERARTLLRERATHADGDPELHAPRLVVVWGGSSGQHLRLTDADGHWLAGRGADCGLRLDDGTLPEAHLEVTRDAEGVTLRCLPDTPPMHLGEAERLIVRPRDGDELRIGDTALLYEEPMEASLRRSGEGVDEVLAKGYRAAAPAPPEAPAPGPVPHTEGGGRTLPAPPVPVTRTDATTRPGIGADLVIYLLAAGVLTLSTAALLVLMGGS